MFGLHRWCACLGLLSRNDWLWWNATDGLARQLPGRKSPLLPGVEEQLWLQTRRELCSGWYLLCIRHRGDNRQVVGFLRQGGSPWRQGRPMFPVRRRWRVVRLARPGRPVLNLQRVQQPLDLLELWLLRLHGWDAWRRVHRRMAQSKELASAEIGLGNRAAVWRYYNKLLAAQAYHHELITYETWQRRVEAKAIASLPSVPEGAINRFALRPWGDFSAIEPDAWAVLLAPGVKLSAWALQAIAYALLQAPGSLLLYGDEDAIRADGKRHSPRFHPAWNRELCWCDPDYCSCWIVAAELWNRLTDRELEGPGIETPSGQGLVLHLTNIAEQHAGIRHLPLVLAHRFIPAPAPLAPEAIQEILRQQLAPQPSPAVAPAPLTSGYRLQWPLPREALLSVVIPMRDRLELTQACLRSIDRHPAGCDLEIVVADNGSEDAETLAWLEDFQAGISAQRRQLVVPAPGPFNYSAINNRAVDHCRGSVLLLLNNDVEFLCDGWGHHLAANALRPGIGCVGALLLHDDLTVQHAGVILGIGGIAAHSHQYMPAESPGYLGRLQLAQELSAVTGACLAIQRRHWDALGGLDARNLAVNYNDVDLCLRAQQMGLRNLYLPQVQALHHESKSRGRPEGAAYAQWRREWAFMKKRWGSLLNDDPAYSPHLSLERQDWSLVLRQPVLKSR